MSSPLALRVQMRKQPDERSCGPTCLQAVYSYFGLDLEIQELIDAIPQLETGGTLAVQLGCDALRRGFDATIYTYNLQLFDPTWFLTKTSNLREVLAEQVRCKPDDGRLAVATARYQDFLGNGGRIRHEVLSPWLLARFLRKGTPILTGLSSTYLYETARELPDEDRPDDIRGSPVGHFVVLSGYDPVTESVALADPWPDPQAPDQLHVRPLYRVLSSILLGVLTYDANLLVIKPRSS
jgi:hypothetical protein